MNFDDLVVGCIDFNIRKLAWCSQSRIGELNQGGFSSAQGGLNGGKEKERPSWLQEIVLVLFYKTFFVLLRVVINLIFF